MKALKVVAEGLTTSFRYPHFMQEVQPSYDMPPPATIYGHICSVLGEWFDPSGVEFAYHFTFEGKSIDLEHTIAVSASTGKLPKSSWPKVLSGKVMPFKREVLFRPRLILYINRPDWLAAFLSPRYAVVLGRSQDLMTYTRVTTVELEKTDRAYFEHTLAPYDMALQLGRGTAALMPRWVDYSRNRVPQFGRYIVLRDRVVLPEDTLQFSHLAYGPYWVDPESAIHKNTHLGLCFHQFGQMP
ncbi:MAG: CRISPR-associated protein Cas5 [Caldilineaceae bacterium]|nr:CRISPR-associated protein Cas5 [Caldilineaceae bacterium]